MSKQNRVEPKVITYFELTGIIILTLSLLILFFPKNSVERLIQSEKSNYDLTIIYLKSIARAYPDDPNNWLRLINAYLEMGNIEEAKNIFKMFQKNANIDEDELQILNYKLIKGKYTNSKTKSQKNRLLKEIEKELENFLKSHNPSLWYFVLNESSQLNLQEIQLKTLQKRIYHQRYIDPNEVIKAFFLAKKLNQNNEAVKLLKYSVSKSNNQKLFDLLISHYSLKKEYIKIAKAYEQRYLKTKQSNLFLNTARLYLLAKDEKKALSWIKEYQNSFLKDPDTSYEIIKLYLSHQKLSDAKSFVTSLMQKNSQVLKKDPKLLRLCLDVMLYSSDLENGAKLARIGMTAFKKDSYWLKKSLQIASWQNDKKEIKTYANQLFQNEGSEKYIKILQNIAKSSNDTDTLFKIYIKKLTKKYNKDDLIALLKLYQDRGNFKEGVLFLTSYYKNHPFKEILRSKIMLEFEYEDFETLKNSLKTYTKIYGYDQNLLYNYAHKLFSKRKYKNAFEIIDKNSKLLTPHKKELWFIYADLAFILQKENRLLKILKQMQKYKILRKSDLEKLFFLYQAKEPKNAFEIAKEDFKINPTKNSFYRLISIATQIGKKNYISNLLNTLPKELLKELKKDSYFHIIKAADFQYNKKSKLALKEFHKAIGIDPYSKETHISYLWFLLSYENRKTLKRELNFISKNFIFDSDVALVVALGYFKLQQATNAKRYMHFALQNDPLNWQLHLQYADILSLSGDENAKQKYMLNAWSLAEKEAKKHNSFKNNKSKLYDFTRIKIYFNPLNTQKYLHDIQNILDSKTIYQLYASTLINQNAVQKIKALINRGKSDDFYLKLYMALNQNDTKSLRYIKNKNKILPLTDHLSVLEKTGAKKEYESLLFYALNYNEHNSHFANIYHEYILKREPTFKSEIQHSNLSKLKYDQLTLSYTNRHSNGINSVTTYNRKENIKNLSKSIKAQNSLSLKLYKSFKNYKVSLKTDFYDRTDNYMGLKAEISHRKNRDSVKFIAEINQNDQSSNYLLLYGRKDLLKVTFSSSLNKNESYQIGYEHAAYKDVKNFLGSSDHLFADYRRFLQRAYPDISFGVSAEIKNYTKNKNLPKSFTQALFNATYGFNSKDIFHRSWRSYASSSFLYNNRSKFGYSFLAGYGGRVNLRDYLGFEAEYSSAKGSRLQDYFSWRIRYLFW